MRPRTLPGMRRLNHIHRVLAVRSEMDPVLHHVAPFGLAATAGTCLVIDLDAAARPYGGRTLADLLESGATGSDVGGGNRGVAVIGNGGVSFAEAEDLIDRLVERWQQVVIRSGPGDHPFPTVSVEPAFPAPLDPPASVGVVQTLSRGQRSHRDVVRLPPIGRGRVSGLVNGQVDPRWSWVRAWAAVWERSWA